MTLYINYSATNYSRQNMVTFILVKARRTNDDAMYK